MGKKFTALILSALMLLPMVPALSVKSKAASVYTVKDASGLAYAAAHPDGDYILANDIDLSGQKNWTPIGTAAKPFSGNFNGNGHVIKLGISGSYTSDDSLVGLFGAVSGSITNLVVSGSINVTVKRAAIGGIAAALTDGGSIYNCTSNLTLTVTSSGQPEVGGIVGVVLASVAETDGKVEQCRALGSINAKVSSTAAGTGSMGDGTNGAIGGLVGFSANGAMVAIEYSVNESTITVDGGSCNVGGILGQTSVNNDLSTANILCCANKGNITIKNLKGERAAGIIGYIRSGKIIACYNTASIIAYSDSGNTVSTNGYGTYYGIFGYANLGTGHTIAVEYCYNASPKALEAEICVVRNASSGTFKNFYMSGRDEYELKLNASNVSAGTAGTTFSSASDLYTKMQNTDAKNYYVQNPNGGYPLLKCEVPVTMTNTSSFAAYVSAREGESSNDLRFVVSADSAKLKSYKQVTLKVSFQGVSTTKTYTLGSELTAIACVTAGGVTYQPASGDALYSAVFLNAPYDGWTSVTATITADGKQVFSATTPYTSLFKAATPVSFASYSDFKALPDYPDGTAAKTVYNAGPGNANDKTSTTSTDSKMLVISGTKKASYTRYLEKLTAAGFKKVSENTVESNLFAEFTYNGQFYYIYYTDYNKQVRIILDKSSTKLPSSINTDAAAGGTTELYQYSLDYTEGTGTYSPDDYWKIDCGMCYIIKFADNSLFIIDGGHERQASDAAMKAFYEFLCSITGTSSTGKLNIVGWFYSHAHGDHVYVGHKFLETYHDKVNVSCTYFNFPSYQVMSSGYDSNTFKMKDTLNKYYPNCAHVKLHTGQSFTIQGVRFDVIFTHEDAVSASGTTTISDFNASSTVLKVTMNGASAIFLGDISDVSQSVICSMYTSQTLKCDIVQAAHHCFNNLPTLYPIIAAKYALIPGSEYNSVQGNAAKLQVILNSNTNVKALYADKYTYKLTAVNGVITVKQLPRYTEAFLIDVPTMSSYTGSTSAEPTVSSGALSGYENLNGYVIDKSVQGTAGAKDTEAPTRLLDGSTDTKYCTKNAVSMVSWTTEQAVSVKGYTLTTGNDTASNPGRNPKTWILKGSVDGKTWITLDEVYDGDLPASNYASKSFLTDNSTACRYFALYVFATDGDNIMQLSELTMYGN